jgi:hypothetical protein
MSQSPLETASVDTPVMIQTQSAGRKHRSPTLSLKRPHPAYRRSEKEFWIAGKRYIPRFNCSPTFVVGSGGGGSSFPQISRPNFADIYEVYFFDGEVFVISEYVGFSVEDLLQRSIHPTEQEIAYIISQELRGVSLVDNKGHSHSSLQWTSFHGCYL